MPLTDYPVDLRADYPSRSSRGWAAATIFLIKFFALLPHGLALLVLFIAQVVVVVVAQVVVAVKGEYPAGMFRFVAGVLRWNTRVAAFVYSLTDAYPPFSLQEDPSYPVDVRAERPASSSRAYALAALVVEALFLAGIVWFVWWVATSIDTWSVSSGGSLPTNLNLPTTWSSGGLVLRDIIALPHGIILVALGFVLFVIWFVVQWVILFTARFPEGMHKLAVGIVRWQTRVSAYTLGLVDRYPPFTTEPSGPAQHAGWPPAPPPAHGAGPSTWPSPPPPAPLPGYQPGPAPGSSAPAPGPPPPAPSGSATPAPPHAPSPPEPRLELLRGGAPGAAGVPLAALAGNAV
jgi:hypothetical protein